MVHASLAGLAGLLLFAAGGPLATDDVWWHLALGRAYSESGPWLGGMDPRLHTALGPPAPNAWLFDIGLDRLVETAGLFALRGLHFFLVALILCLVWLALKRRSDSPLAASLGSALFIACSSYRLLQLRPALSTILATLVLYFVILESSRPSWLRVGLAAALCALWANLHPGFILGPVLLTAAAAAAWLDGLVRSREGAPRSFDRALRLAGAAGLAFLATGLNPAGFAAYAAYVDAGIDSTTQGVVIDEWRSFDLFALPMANLPPTPLAWLCMWLLLLATLWVGGIAIADRLGRPRPGSRQPLDVDLGLGVLAGLGLIAPWIAVRFVWLCLFPLLLLAWFWRVRVGARRAARVLWAAAAASLLLVPAYIELSDWSILAPKPSWERWQSPYEGDRYYAHSVWFLMDSGVEGNLFNPYFMGGFLEYWLGPRLRAFVDGSLNFPAEVLDEYALIQTHGMGVPGVDIVELLENRDVDFFVGVGLPIPPRAGRPWRYTTDHLERAPEWMLVFRSLNSSVYMRRSDRNRANLERIAAYYAGAGVPFDRKHGLDVAATLSNATDWAIEHGLAPIDFPHLVAAARRGDERTRSIATRRLASTYAALGLYSEAIQVDTDMRGRGSFTGTLPDPARMRRLIWSAMRLDREQEALQWAEAEPRVSLGPISRQLVEGLRAYTSATNDLDRARIAAMTTVFSAREGGQLKGVQQPPPMRLGYSGSQFSRIPTPAR